MEEIDYATDLPKHFVRKMCWLPVCDKRNTLIRRHKQKYPTKYFTFCAADAIDVFMLARAGVLQRSADTGRLKGVYFCEMNDDSFSRIADLIGSAEQGFLGDFQEIVLYDDDIKGDHVDESNGAETGEEANDEREDEDPEITSEQRRRLRVKDANERLRNAFPFDIINLDVFGALFPPNATRGTLITPLLQSILRILSWQTSAVGRDKKPLHEFTLLLTTHISPRQTDAAAVEQLQARLQQNLDTYGGFREPFEASFHHHDAYRLSVEDFAAFYCISFPKYIIEKAVHDFKWKVDFGPVYLYDRTDNYIAGGTYQIMHAVFEFTRLENAANELHNPSLSEYVRAITEVAQEAVVYVTKGKLDAERASLTADLEEIARFRDDTQRQPN